MADNDGAKGSEYIVSCGVRGCHQLFAFSGRELSDGGSSFDKEVTVTVLEKLIKEHERDVK